MEYDLTNNELQSEEALDRAAWREEAGRCATAAEQIAAIAERAAKEIAAIWGDRDPKHVAFEFDLSDTPLRFDVGEIVEALNMCAPTLRKDAHEWHKVAAGVRD